jgi:GNAT superfamily N-acetyltransferase
MNKEVIIRKGQEKDLGLIVDLIKELAVFEKLLDEVVADEAILRKSLFGDKQYAEVVIAEVDAIPMGFALFFHNFSTFLGRPGIYLEDLYVRPEARGKGVGKKLLQYLAALCVERECGRLEWSVLDWNKGAIGFYESIGAKPMDGWSTYRLDGEALVNFS